MIQKYDLVNREITLISICIATYKRELLLDKLLKSLSRQILPEFINIEIIVTDNDKAESAKEILLKYTNTKVIKYRYFLQPEKNISLTRNVCIENSSGKFICFIDDDETASDTWISNLYDAVIRYNADGVFGFVEPVFDVRIPLHFRKRDFYFSQVKPTGENAEFFYTTNALIRAEWVKKDKILFEPRFGLTGGEDVHFFERILKKGARFITSRDAMTFEYIPIERGTEAYLFSRSYRGGQSFINRKKEFGINSFSKTILFCRSIIIATCALILYKLYPNKTYKLKFLIFYGAAMGKVKSILGIQKNIY